MSTARKCLIDYYELRTIFEDGKILVSFTGDALFLHDPKSEHMRMLRFMESRRCSMGLLMFLVCFHLEMLQKEKMWRCTFPNPDNYVSFSVKVISKLLLVRVSAVCNLLHGNFLLHVLLLPSMLICSTLVFDEMNWFFYFLSFCIVSIGIFETMKIVYLYLLERWCTS